jgi:hypothetical protein
MDQAMKEFLGDMTIIAQDPASLENQSLEDLIKKRE